MKTISVIILSFILLNFSYQENEFVFKKGNEKATLVILSNKKYLKLNETNKLKFVFENIDRSKAMITGINVKVLSENNALENECYFEVLAAEKNLVDGKIRVILSYKSIKGVGIFDLKIPVQ